MVRLLDTVANDFYSSSLFSSLLPPVAMDWWARNDNFPSLSFCCCFFFLLVLRLFKRALSSVQRGPRRQRVGKGCRIESVKYAASRNPLHFRIALFFDSP